MPRTISTAFLVGLILLNGAAGIMEASGLNDALNMSLDPGGDQQIDEKIDDSKGDINATGGFGDTLFSVFGAVGSAFSGFLELVTIGPRMLINVGIPSFFVTALLAPLFMIAALDIYFALSGRKL